MSISDKNKKAIFEHFSINEIGKPRDKNRREYKEKESSEIKPKHDKQLPTNLANRRLGEEFFGIFGKPDEQPEYYYRDEETQADAFVNNDGDMVYDPYIVLKN
mgnify:CR=1 FL=1